MRCAACGEENPKIARFCLACGSALAPPPPARRKLATLLFCDVSGSTAAGERLDAEAVRAMMSEYFEAMRDAIERHGGTVEKFVGDAVMAVFGVPLAREDDAQRAVAAAVAMRRRLDALNADLERRFGATIELRIGVNTGEVVAGDVTTRQTIVTGDAVNVAARLEQAARPGEILLGETTWRLVQAGVRAEPIPPLTVKGKAAPLTAFRLHGLDPRGRRQQGASLLGREDELQSLRRALAAALDSRRAVIATVLGEAGVGKSRLAEAFVAAVGAEARVVRGRCLSYGEGITFWPIAEIVRELTGTDERATADAARAGVRAVVAAGDDGPLVADRIERLTGVTDGSIPPAEAAWAIRRLLAITAAERPLVAVVDDLQWAEPALLDALESLAGVDAPILLVALARPELSEIRPEWPVHLRLDPLGRSAARRLLEEALGAPAEDGLRDELERVAAGNPLYLHELARMLVDGAHLRLQDGRFVASGDVTALPLPPSLTALLGARVDQLGDGERDVAERGSVEGEVFHREAVTALAAADGAGHVLAYLEALAARGVVHAADERSYGDLAYRFRHLLLRDAVYRSMAKGRRAAMHERFADWLERRLGRRTVEYDEVLGFHRERAYRYLSELGPVRDRERRLADRAGEHLAAAGARAIARFDMGAAVKLLRRAVALLGPEHAGYARAQSSLATALERSGEFDAARAAAAEAAIAARRRDDAVGEQRALLTQAWISLWTDVDGFDAGALRTVAGEARRVFAAAGDEQGLAQAWRMEAEIASGACRGADCVAAAERAAEHARRAGDAYEEAESIMKALIVGGLGPMHTAEVVRRCEALLARRAGVYVTATAYGASSAALAMQGSLDESRRRITRALDLLTELGLDFYAAAASVTHDGGMLLNAGRWAEAEATLRAACRSLGEMGDTAVRSTGLGLLALAVVEQGRVDEADELSREAERLSAPEDVLSQVLWRRARARALASRGDPAHARDLAVDAVRRAGVGDDYTLHGGALVDLGLVEHAAGRTDAAAARLAEAVTLFERKGNTVAAGRARALLEGRLRAVGP